MTFVLLKEMLKEEWRIFTTIIGRRLFLCFPLLIGVGVFVASLSLPFLRSIMTTEQLLRSAHYVFLIFGVSIGAFGLFGKEVMNRRFGQASLLAYSSRSLPVSERVLFLNFFMKDILYYLLLWVVPLITGFLLATPFIHVSLVSGLVASGTLVLSFLLGLSLVFFLSTLYAHSSKLLIMFLVLGGIVLVVFSSLLPWGMNTVLLPYRIYYQPSFTLMLLTVVLIIVPAAFSLLFIKVDYPEQKKHYRNSFHALSGHLSFTRYAAYVAKDFLDLKRSEGGVGKLIFQFLFPVALTWMFLSVFAELIPEVKAVMIFSIFLGIVSSSMYTMLTAFDSFNPYLFLPIPLSTILRSKLVSYLLFNSISLMILILAAVGMDQLLYFVPALFLFLTISVYSLSMTIYFAGLQPSTFLYNSKIFSQYILCVAPLLFFFTIASIVNPFFMLASPVFLVPAVYILKKSYQKWDHWQPLAL